MGGEVEVYGRANKSFVHPSNGPISEDKPIGDVSPMLRSALAAEEQTARFAHGGGRGVVLRLGLLDGPGTGEYPPLVLLGATLHVSDAGRALLAALSLPSGFYHVCRDGERAAGGRLPRAAGWRRAA